MSRANLIRAAGLTLCLSLLGGAASGEAAPVWNGPIPLKEARWAKPPNVDALLQLYPPAARRTGVTGSASVKCHISKEGRPTDCAVTQETPPDAGFGAATVSFVGSMRLLGRFGPNATIEVPVHWTLPERAR